jgi:hypothetical protein
MGTKVHVDIDVFVGFYNNVLLPKDLIRHLQEEGWCTLNRVGDLGRSII